MHRARIYCIRTHNYAGHNWLTEELRNVNSYRVLSVVAFTISVLMLGLMATGNVLHSAGMLALSHKSSNTTFVYISEVILNEHFILPKPSRSSANCNKYESGASPSPAHSNSKTQRAKAIQTNGIYAHACVLCEYRVLTTTAAAMNMQSHCTSSYSFLASRTMREK